MNVEILDEAERDLIDGFRSTKVNPQDLAITSWTPCSRTLTHSDFTQAFMRNTADTIVFSPNDFPLPSTTRSSRRLLLSTLSWIAVAIRPGSKND